MIPKTQTSHDQGAWAELDLSNPCPELDDFRGELSARVKGQDEAIKYVSDMFLNYRSGLMDRSRRDIQSSDADRDSGNPGA